MQIGTSSLFNLTLGSALLLPGLLAPVWWSMLVGISFIGSMVLHLVPFILAALAINALRKVLRRRASDLVIDANGVRIEGGRLHGMSFDIKELRAESWRVATRGQLHTLEIDLPGTSEMVLAETSDERERQNFEDVAQTIRATFGNAPAQDAARASPHLMRCPSCGGEAAPDTRPTVPCRYCQSPVPMPDDVRAKLEQAAERKKKLARSEVLIEQLLRQPPVASTNRIIALVGATMLLVWPASIATCIVLLYQRKFSDDLALSLLVAPIPLILGLFLAAAFRLVDRQALQLVTLGMGADPPRSEGEPHHCRSCGGPLPEPGNEVVVDCAFCDVENVFGFELRHALGKAVSQVASLEQALRWRSMRRRGWVKLALIVVAGVLGCYGIVLGARTVIHEAVASSKRLYVCTREYLTVDAYLSASLRYTCDRHLDRNDQVMGSDLLAAFALEPDPLRHHVVRTIAPGADARVGTDGVVLIGYEDYVDFIVRYDDIAYIFVDHVYTKPSDSDSGAASEVDSAGH